jgi:hypothetical protein
MRRVYLGSIVIPVPEDCRLRLTVGPDEELLAATVVADFGEVDIRAHAAPKQGSAGIGGQWRPMLTELAQELREHGLRLFFQDGPWGRELIAVGGGVFRRLIGRDGDRWTLAASSSGPDSKAALLTDFAREILAGTEVRRGEEPHPARAALALRIVDPAALGDWERAEAVPDRQPDPEPFLPPFPDPQAPGAKGTAIQQLRALQSQS